MSDLPVFVYGGFTFGDDVDADGVLWSPHYGKCSGWYDGVGVRADRTDRTGQDGTWPTAVQRSGRTVVIGGTAFAPDLAAAQRAMRRFSAVPTVETLTVLDGLGELTARCSLDAQPLTDPTSPTSFDYQLTLHADDPLKYGALAFAQTDLSDQSGTGLAYPLAYPLDYGVPQGATPGAVVVANAGTATYWPRLRIDGPVTNPMVSLVETGDWVRYNGSLLPGQWLDVDLGNRTVLLNGSVDVRQNVSSSGNWLGVPTGVASMTWVADDADSRARLNIWSYEGVWS